MSGQEQHFVQCPFRIFAFEIFTLYFSTDKKIQKVKVFYKSFFVAKNIPSPVWTEIAFTQAPKIYLSIYLDRNAKTRGCILRIFNQLLILSQEKCRSLFG